MCVTVPSTKAQLPPHGGKISNTVARKTLHEANCLQIESIHHFFYCKGDWALEQLDNRGHGASILGDMENPIATALSNLLWVSLLWAGLRLDSLQRTLPTSATLRFCDLAIYPEQAFSKSVVMNMVEGTGRGSNDFVPLCSSPQKGYRNFNRRSRHCMAFLSQKAFRVWINYMYSFQCIFWPVQRCLGCVILH